MKIDNFSGEVFEDIMPQKADLIDKKILYILSNNCRISDTAIAHYLKTSREVVSYRVKQLLDKKLLAGFTILLDQKKIGFSVHTLFIKLAKINDEKKLITELVEDNRVTALLACGGRFDLYLDITTRNAEEFDNFFSNFQNKYVNIIQEFTILDYIKEYPLGNEVLFDQNTAEIDQLKYLIETKGSAFQKEFKYAEKKDYIIDNQDKKILNILNGNGKATLRDISQSVKLTPGAVKSRISNLVKSGIIKNFTSYISFQSLGYQWYIVLFNMIAVNETKLNAFLKSHQNTEWLVKYIGNWNYQVSIFARDNKEFHSSLNQIREEFAENIIAFDSLIVFNQHKFLSRVD